MVDVAAFGYDTALPNLCVWGGIALFFIVVGLLSAVCEWRDAQAYAVYSREKGLVKLHLYAAQLRAQVAAREALERAA